MSGEALDQLNDNTLYRTLGLRLLSCAHGEARSRLDPPAALCWPFDEQPHGGILFTQMDTTLATAVLPDLRKYTCATISLEIQFTRRARQAPFTCAAWTTHRGRQIAFGRAEIRDAGQAVVAMGQGTFKLIERAPESGR